MAVKKSIAKVPLTETQLVFEKLKAEISQTLAPRLIGLLEEFGYDSVNVSSSSGNRNSITTQELTGYITMEARGWVIRLGSRAEDSHNSLLHILKRLKETTEHLMKLRNEAERYLEWIGKIGTVGTRQVLIEKFKKKKSR